MCCQFESPQTACQDEDDDDEDDDEGEQAEKDAILVECAGDLIPSVIKALDGQKEVALTLVTEMLPLLVARTVSSEHLSSFDAPRGTPGYGCTRGHHIVWHHLASARGKIM